MTGSKINLNILSFLVLFSISDSNTYISVYHKQVEQMHSELA
jgi:hypothetical protein